MENCSHEDSSPMVKQMQVLEQNIQYAHDRICVLEQKIEDDDCQTFEIIESIGELAKKVDDQKLENHISDAGKKVPNKCIICDGTGKHPDQTKRLLEKVFTKTGIYCCNACDGSGVLWG